MLGESGKEEENQLAHSQIHNWGLFLTEVEGRLVALYINFMLTKRAYKLSTHLIVEC